ncbi:Mesaconyl-C(4)-CoA hydratase [Beauveria bassiana]|nr:Mesaconyl-C(4)-CoA hydratase [Beauveria bassiana]
MKSLHFRASVQWARKFETSARHQQSTAQDAAARLLDTFAGKTVSRRQLIDGNQLQKLSLTLGRTCIGTHNVTERPPPVGTPVPPGHHLVYFTPSGVEDELGADGSDRTYNAAAPFSRRMWAGGTMQWSAESASIRVGDEVEERTTLLSATAKKSRSAGEMVLVEVVKELQGPRGVALVDRRSWVFRPEVDPSSAAAAPKPPRQTKQGPTVIKDVKSASSWLFRFSALTFNGHKIHYNEGWTTAVEGHPGVVVHGPLNLINILDYWRDVHGNGQAPKEIIYRAMSPLYAGDQYQVHTANVEAEAEGNKYQILADKDGVVCMKAVVL